MKKVFAAITIVLGILIVLFIFEKVSAQSGFGPAALAATLLLIISFILFLLTTIFYNTRFRELMTRIWMVLISIIVTYLVVELLASFFLLKPLSPPLAPDEYRHHKLITNTNSYFEQRDFSYIQRVNNFGLRGDDIRVNKDPNKFRILMLGDSFTMGKGVEDNETFSALVQDSLNKTGFTIDSKSVEVLNCGVDSYAPVLSYIQLTRDLAPLEPDMVILNIDNSDLMQETAYRNQAKYNSDGEIIAVPGSRDNSSLTDKIRNWTERNLYITRLLFYYINKLFDYKELSVRSMVTQANYEVVKHTLAEDKENRKQQWINIFDSITRIKQYCDDHNIKFLLTVYPWGHQVNDQEWLPGRYNFMPKGVKFSDKSLNRIIEFTSINSIQLLNQFPLFRSYNGTFPLYFNYDMHFTPAGHILMANGFVKYLSESLGNDKIIGK